VVRSLIERGDGEGRPDPAVVEHKWNLFLELVRWAEGGSCRHDAILRYFGDEEETLAGCGVCDVCARLAAGTDAASLGAEETAEVVRKALSGVARVHGRFGLGAAVKLLRGEGDPRLERAGLDRVSTFGVLAERRADWLTRVLRRCVTAGLVGFQGDERPVLVLTEAGRRVMRAERPARLELPPPRPRAAGGKGAGRRGGSPRAGSAAEATPGPADRALFEALRAHRLRVARSAGVPPYVVAHDRTLLDLARQRPRTREELLLVDGIGPARAERFGEGFLAVLRGGEGTPEG